MIEQIITFETAKLAKEKGFDGLCYDCYNSQGNLYSNGWCEYIDDDEQIDIPFTKSEIKPEDFIAPSQSLLQKWLRELHNFHIIILHWSDTLFSCELRYPHNYGVETVRAAEGCKTYEKALEKGLQEALKLINNGKNN